ncbi:PGC-1 and ERR-induced regulator in muscle protein 1-like [Echeneis naucrates]|nr:PGC-1 and ERR-induced regulator in muscle protein 1 [Echeneis naucrates]
MQEKDMDSLSSSLKDSYKISVMDIFQYFFGEKQSIPRQSPIDNKTTPNTDGNSVPETYDHFFSDFDTENVFSLFLTTEDEPKDELVPIFSYSRSANRNFQFPEAYDYFFESSSPDDSSVESEGEDDYGPVRVVTRFSRKASSSQISTDIYDNFYTDSDLRQDFFWKTTLSFRNRNFAGSTFQKQSLSRSLSDVNVSQRGGSLRRTVYPSNALGNQDMLFPDLLLYNLEDRILRKQAQHPFRCEDLQTAVSNPRLDASFLRLRQSDMCLVCIAFASWVLKTANPQVGDAWKAVLLANVSALSAIRYLRKYVKIEAATSEKKPRDTTPSES